MLIDNRRIKDIESSKTASDKPLLRVYVEGTIDITCDICKYQRIYRENDYINSIDITLEDFSIAEDVVKNTLHNAYAGIFYVKQNLYSSRDHGLVKNKPIDICICYVCLRGLQNEDVVNKVSKVIKLFQDKE